MRSRPRSCVVRAFWSTTLKPAHWAAISIMHCAGVVRKDQVHADLAELAAGRKRGRMADEELVIFDSSGSGVQDVAAAWAAYQEACRARIGARFNLSGIPTE